MDAYLSRDALKYLQALNLISSSASVDGLLIGHTRGHRYFVEKVFPTKREFIGSLQNYLNLDQLFDGKIIGFYSFQNDPKKIKKILAPFAYGKLFLEIHSTSQKELDIKSFIIDFDNKFFLSPITLKGK